MSVEINIKNDPQFFYCERMKCTLKKTACVDRHGDQKRNGSWMRSKYLECEKCEQGDQIAAEIAKGKYAVEKKVETVVKKMGPVVVESKQCGWCGDVFSRTDETDYQWDHKKYCSPECQKAAKNKLSRESYYRNKNKKKPVKTVEIVSKPIKTDKATSENNATHSQTAINLLIKTLKIHGSDLPNDPVFCEYLTLAYEMGRAA